MRTARLRFSEGKVLALCLLAGSCSCTRNDTSVEVARSPTDAKEAPSAPPLDVPYEPSAPEVVEEMLRLANVVGTDVVYDLGCGDGRIVIGAVKASNARGVCVDIDPERIRESRDNARRAGVEDRILFLNQDLFETDITDATVVMLFLWPKVNLRLRGKLLRELKPGTRIVSHWHDMGEWAPDATTTVVSAGKERPIYLWRVPDQA